MSTDHTQSQVTGMVAGPTDPELIQQEVSPTPIAAGSEETLSDIDMEEDVRDYDLGEGD